MTSLSWLKLCSDILSWRKIAELLDRTREACRRLVLWSPRSHQLPSSHLKAPGSGNSEPPVGPPTALPGQLCGLTARCLFRVSPRSPLSQASPDHASCPFKSQIFRKGSSPMQNAREAVTERLSLPFRDAPCLPGNADDLFCCLRYLCFFSSAKENEHAFI